MHVRFLNFIFNSVLVKAKFLTEFILMQYYWLFFIMLFVINNSCFSLCQQIDEWYMLSVLSKLVIFHGHFFSGANKFDPMFKT